MERLIFNILIILLNAGFCYGFDIFPVNFHDYCGKTITNYAGELKFDAESLPSNVPGGKCSVTVRLQRALFSTQIQALFYFTKFDIYTSCKEANVTVVDGIPDNGSEIIGLPPIICGHNKTLENPDSFFTTKSDKLTVTFKRRDDMRIFYGKFSIKFIQFSTGACNGQCVYVCSNGRCIPNVYQCSTDLNACGEKQADCSNKGEVAVSFSDSVLNIVRNVLSIGAGVVAIYIFRIYYRKYRKRSRPERRNLYGGQENEIRRSTSAAYTVQNNPLSTEQIPLSTEGEQQELRHLCSDETVIDK